MIIKTRLEEIHDDLAEQFPGLRMSGQGRSSFMYVTNDGRAVEISEGNGGFWLEFWEKDEDEDAAPVKEKTVVSCQQAIQETKQWLG